MQDSHMQKGQEYFKSKMAIQVTYICDSCGRTVTPENGVIGDHEFTIERRFVFKYL